jgi:ribosomal protein L7Ae-like RNA K-turn-binding protein
MLTRLSLQDSAAAAAPGPDGSRGAAEGSALANSLFAYVKAAKAKKDAAAAASRAGIALGFSGRPRAGGERMVNPNAASATAVVTRRGKERLGGRKKRVTALKKVILRERAAKLAARQAADPAADSDAASDANAPSTPPNTAALPDADADAEDEEEEAGGGDIVLHLERGHVYISVSAADGAVRLSTIVVEEDDLSSSSDEDDDASSASSEAESEAESGEEDAEDGDDLSEESSDSSDIDDEVDVGAAGAAHAAAQLRAAAAPFVPASVRRAEAAAARVEVHECAVCGISTVGAASLAQHMAGRRHRKGVAAAAAAAAAPAGGPAAAPQPPAAPLTYIGPDAALRYGRQVLSRELNGCAAAMLSRLMELQARLRATDPLRAKAKRRVVFGLREAAKAVRARRVKLLVVVPNVEAVAAPGGLDEALTQLLDAARSGGVPVALALTRAKMGALTGRRVRMSAAAVLDSSGAEEAFAQTLALAAAGREQWRKAHPDAPPEALVEAPAAPDAFLRLRRDGRTRALLPGETAGLPGRAGGEDDAGAAARSCIVSYR